MIVHVALFSWKDDASPHQVVEALKHVKAMKEKVPGILDIRTGTNFSEWGEGYTHAIVVMAETQAALDQYRAHPDHKIVSDIIESMEENSLGVDFED